VDRDLLVTRGEHYRYTNLGIFVAMIGVLATASFLIFSTTIAGTFHAAMIPVAVGWGLLIFFLDRSIVAEPSYGDLSMVRFRSWRADRTEPPVPDAAAERRSGALRGGAFGLRFVIAVLVAYLIGEALLLAVFRPEVEQVRTERQQAAFAQVSEDFIAAKKGLVDGIDVATTDRAAELGRLITEENQRQNDLDQEKRGTAGSGQVGDGPEAAEKRRRLADARDQRRKFEATKPGADQQDQEQKKQLQTEIAAIQGNDPTVIDTIPDLREARDRIRKNTGWVESEAALQQYLDQNPTFTVVVVPWILRILLITIDLLPLMLKMSNGRTIYGQRQRDRADQLRYSDAADDLIFAQHIDRSAKLDQFRAEAADRVARRQADFHRDWRLTYFDVQARQTGLAEPERDSRAY
jgi:hypothetical protein